MTLYQTEEELSAIRLKGNTGKHFQEFSMLIGENNPVSMQRLHMCVTKIYYFLYTSRQGSWEYGNESVGSAEGAEFF
jgi:hypothetical protein